MTDVFRKCCGTGPQEEHKHHCISFVTDSQQVISGIIEDLNTEEWGKKPYAAIAEAARRAYHSRDEEIRLLKLQQEDIGRQLLKHQESFLQDAIEIDSLHSQIDDLRRQSK